MKFYSFDETTYPGIPRDIVAPAAQQIVQAPGYVMHLLEYSHAYRVIPITNEPHVPGAVKLWQGNSRGHWEANTLVVDVANLNGLAWFDNAGNFASDALHVVERYAMIDRDTIHYEARIEDPKVYTRPWTMVSALTRNKDADKIKRVRRRKRNDFAGHRLLAHRPQRFHRDRQRELLAKKAADKAISRFAHRERRNR